jgi:hypothetical protein
MSSTTNPTSYGLDTVNISFLPFTNESATKHTMPLVISPRWDASLDFFKTWSHTNRSYLDSLLLEYGAILFRGFAVTSPQDMQDAVFSLQPHLNNTYRGTSPRQLLGQTDYVFSAAEVPSHYPIAQHIEMSFLPAPPKNLYFGCLQAPTSAGGETALADFRRVYADIPRDLRQKLLDKGLLYTRTHKKHGARFTYDVSDMLGWPELFGTNDKSQVEQMCAAEGIHVEWDGDTFVSKTYSQAFQLHPVTGEHVWFNHTQVFHWTTFAAELLYAFQRTKEWRLLAHAILVGLFCLVKYGILQHKMSLHSSFGDGSPISVAEMATIRAAIHKNMVFSRWQKGDIMAIDNFSTSHGRQPTYDKGRKIAVCWSDPIAKVNAVTSLDAMPVVVRNENPQEQTPPTTLTHRDSMQLQDIIKTTAETKEFPVDQSASFSNLKNLFHEVKQRHSPSSSQPARSS